jgi:hypothetical protein
LVMKISRHMGVSRRSLAAGSLDRHEFLLLPLARPGHARLHTSIG